MWEGNLLPRKWWGFSEVTFAKTQGSIIITRKGGVHPSWEGRGEQRPSCCWLHHQKVGPLDTVLTWALTDLRKERSCTVDWNSFPDYFRWCPELGTQRLPVPLTGTKFVRTAKAEYVLQMRSCFLPHWVRAQKLRASRAYRESPFQGLPSPLNDKNTAHLWKTYYFLNWIYWGDIC